MAEIIKYSDLIAAGKILTELASGDYIMFYDVDEVFSADKIKLIAYSDLVASVLAVATQKTIVWRVLPADTAIGTGNGQDYFCVPEELNTYKITKVHAAIDTPSSSGTPTFQLRNVDNGDIDILSTRITIDEGERNSYTAATPPVVNTSNQLVYSGNRLAADFDVAGTGAKGVTYLITVEPS